MNCSKCKERERSRNHTWCRECLRLDAANRRKDNPEVMTAICRKSRHKVIAIKREYVNDLKSNTPCKDCDNTFPSYVMQFDHRDASIKKAAVALLVQQTCSLETLQKEIEKCDLVCANCHAVRTHLRRKDARRS